MVTFLNFISLLNKQNSSLQNEFNFYCYCRSSLEKAADAIQNFNENNAADPHYSIRTNSLSERKENHNPVSNTSETNRRLSTNAPSIAAIDSKLSNTNLLLYSYSNDSLDDDNLDASTLPDLNVADRGSSPNRPMSAQKQSKL